LRESHVSGKSDTQLHREKGWLSRRRRYSFTQTLRHAAVIERARASASHLSPSKSLKLSVSIGHGNVVTGGASFGMVCSQHAHADFVDE
jgi:hypothetical protein